MRDPEIEQAAKLAAEFNNGERGFTNRNKINVYTCTGSTRIARGQIMRGSSCGHRIVTIDREPGVTPFIVRCQQCGGEATSSFYRGTEGLEPTHEWYRPDTTTGLDRHTAEHVLRGGLILREIVPAKSPIGCADIKWTRFLGTFANIAIVDIPAGLEAEPTIGVAANSCAECQTHHVQIACIAASGHEVNVGVLPEVALEIARSINAAALAILKSGGRG